MYVFGLSSIVLVSLSALAKAVAPERTTDIFAWPLSALKSQTLTTVSYSADNASIKSYTTPSIPADEDIVRIGFYHADGRWSGVATAASNFVTGKPKTLLLHVKTNGELYHVGFRATEDVWQSSATGSKDELSVEVVKIKPGPLPHLNKPVVLDAEGNLDNKEPEKTFLQKYWWVIGGFLVLQLVMSGASESK